MRVFEFIASKSFSSFKKSFTKIIIRLAVMATTLSLSVMIVAQSIFNGFQKEIAKKVFGFWGHIHITDIQSSQSLDPFTLNFSDSIRSAISSYFASNGKREAIDHIQGFIIYPAIISHNVNTEGLFIKGVGQDFRWDFFSSFLTSGKPFNTQDTSFEKSILVSEETAKNLQIRVGSKLTINIFLNQEILKRRVTVCGIYNTGLAEYDKKFALVDIRMMQDVLNKQSDEVTGIEVFCRNVLDADKVNQQLFEKVIPETWYSETIRNKFPNIFEWLALQDITKYFILSLIIAVCIINMATTLMILILERTHMIGVLNVLGMRSWVQRKIFLRYATRILLTSLIAGNTIGYAILYLQHKYQIIKLSEADYYLSHAPVDLNIIPILVLNLIFFTVVLFSLIVPSWLVTFIRPVNALKFR